MTRDKVEADAEGRVAVSRRFCDLQESYLVKRWKVPEIVFEAVGLAVELVDYVVVALPG